MASVDMATWRRQNSDPVALELELADGTTRKGTLLVPRGKSLREVLNADSEVFVDFECRRDGSIVIAKSAIRVVRPADSNKNADEARIAALEARRAELERMDPYKFLGVSTNVDNEGLRKAYIEMARAYHPDKFSNADLPTEVTEYLNAMARRINAVYEDLQELIGK